MAHPGIVFLDEAPRAGRYRRKPNAAGILGCVFSVLGILTAGILSPIGLGLSLLGMLRRPRGAATAGAVIGGLGTAFLLLWTGMIVAGVSAAHDARNEKLTQVTMDTAVAAVERYHREHDKLPDGVDGNKLLIAGELNDAWKRPLRYDPVEMDGHQPTAYAIRSAGPDGEFDTGDDLTRF